MLEYLLMFIVGIEVFILGVLFGIWNVRNINNKYSQKEVLK